MTFEQRMIIGFGDIKAVIFECNACKVRTSIPISELSAANLSCPKRHGWIVNKFAIDRSTAFDALALLLTSLADKKFQDEVGFKVFLECESKKD